MRAFTSAHAAPVSAALFASAVAGYHRSMEAYASVENMMWRRLDVEGHDSCRLTARDGFRLEGTAVFRDAAGPAALTYIVDCDRAWRCVGARVNGFVGVEHVDVVVARSPDPAADGAWCVNGVAVAATRHTVDVDLGFTPSTNVLQLRRLALSVGDSTDVDVAWLDVPRTGAPALALLPQRYSRLDVARYDYHAPSVGYAAVLEVAPSGFITHYPGLWRAV